MKIIIIEDEKPLAEDLSRTILSIMPEAVIKAVIPSVEEGIEYLSKSPDIDLIFSDIKLGDGLSFDIFKEVDNKVPVIFCTAFNQYTLEAFDSMGIDYIIKPFSNEAVAKALQKFKLLQPKASLDFAKIISTFKTQSMPSVIVYQGERIIPISGNNIALFYIQDNVVIAYTFDKKTWVLGPKLDILEQKFFPFFYRANRQFLINRKAVNSASQYFHRKIILTLNIDFPEKILVGKEKVTDFLEWLSQN
ncbi:LytR/AlgR family response regulator transcription factor [Flavobacterium soyae]|uniref:LytR/AlgR family response regulator transcription factor n=1 Tax=Flavobacterium soyae TaxID=2903098 RepID=UPI001E335134|nr:LytTR family DNA-binding domain-containing protein [Flavobacterium soyae]MCD9576229.1 LytTR family DNA-binding domain-containing protein [Flavobacterium soyae]